MEYKSKLNHVFEKMSFSNVEVARYGELDASLISRFRTGKRIPSKGSQQIFSLCKGLVMLAQEQGKMDELCTLCDITITKNAKILLSKLKQWFEDTDSSLKNPRHNRSITKPIEIPQKHLRAFSEKLNALMEAFEISNIRLAHIMHIDASLISRFRTGMRVPTVNSWFPDQFCEWLANRAATLSVENCNNLLLPLIGEPMPENAEDLKGRLLEWMQSEPELTENILAGSFLDKLNAYQPIFDIPKQLVDSLLKAPVLRGPSESFYGIEGLRKAVRQFLTLTATQPEPHTLYLYSDQPMDWMSSDPEYAKIWAVLMSIVLYQKNHICIIHNIDRSYQEMFDAFQKWIPLYMTGLIQSHYCENNQDTSFYQTKFILPDLYSVNASFVAGTEDFAEYVFSSEKSRVQYHFRQFNELLNSSRPLLSIFHLRTPDDFRRCGEALTNKILPEKHLRYTLSIATMPDEIFDRILSRSNLRDEKKSLANEYRQNCTAKFRQVLEHTCVTELIYMPKTEQVFSQRIDLPSAIIGKALFYEEAEYADHISNIQKLLQENEQYHFYILPEIPFENVIITVIGDLQSLVVKIDEPSTGFLFEHMLMNRAFSGYLDSLAQKVMHGDYNRSAVIGRLS